MTTDLTAATRPQSTTGITSSDRLLSALRRLGLADDLTPLPLGLLAAALCLAVGVVHVQDQGGFLGSVTPVWLKVGYYAVEAAAVVTIPLILRQKLGGWILASLVAIGPFIGYVASRTVGVPGDPGDVGNWAYTLGTVSLVVEGALFLLSVGILVRWKRTSRSSSTTTVGG